MKYDYITATGVKVDFLNPETATFSWKDIEIHTENLNRYNGAVKWSLIQHLGLCLELSDRQFQDHPQKELINVLSAIHDFHEIYVGDIVSGLKGYLPDFNLLEEKWERWVHETLGISWEERCALQAEIKHIDLTALVLEMTHLGHPAAPIVEKKYNINPRARNLTAAWAFAGHDYRSGKTFNMIKKLVTQYAAKQKVNIINVK